MDLHELHDVYTLSTTVNKFNEKIQPYTRQHDSLGTTPCPSADPEGGDRGSRPLHPGKSQVIISNWTPPLEKVGPPLENVGPPLEP